MGQVNPRHHRQSRDHARDDGRGQDLNKTHDELLKMNVLLKDTC
jgi:hypothetical protein